MAKVIVIGAGLSGMAVAAIMAHKGYEVSVYEKNSVPGGRAMKLEENGFKFDMGPSWYLMPEVFEKFFALFDKKVGDFYELTKLDPGFKVFFEDGSSNTINVDKEKVVEEFAKIEGFNRKNNIRKFFKKVASVYEISTRKILYANYNSLFDLLKPKLFTESLKSLYSLNIFSSFENFIDKTFYQLKSKQILGFSSVFLGGSPYNVPAFYSLILNTVFNQGIFYPKGGVNKVVDALYELSKELGVKYFFNEPVYEIKSENDKVTHVLTEHGPINADVVICSTDYANAEISLLKEKDRSYSSEYWNTREYSISALLAYVGVKGKLKNFCHHSFLLSDEWKDSFDSIFKQGNWPKKPSVYVSTTSKSDDTVAPEGCENLVFLIPVPSNLDSDKKMDKEAYFNEALQRLEKASNERIVDKIVYKKLFTPTNFSITFNAFNGNAMGLAHTFNQSLFLRPRFKSKKLNNLFFTGQFTDPGIGMPMMLVSAQKVAKLVEKDFPVKK